MPLSNTGTDRFLAQNYYSKTQLNSGQLDTRYFAESEFINASAGAGDSGKPVKLNSSGKIDATMITDSDIDHGSTGGLTDDDHTQYALLLGRSGGQALIGGTASGNNLTLRSSSHATKGKVIFGNAGTTAYDEVNERLGIGTASPSAQLHVVGASNTQVILGYPDGASGYGELQYRDQTSGNVKWGIGANADSASSPNFFYLFQYRNAAEGTVNAYRLLVNDSGAFGIGASPTSDLLTVGGTINANAMTVGGVAVVTLSGAQTLTNKTLTTPTISGTGFANANHAHTGSTSGGTLDHGAAMTGLGDDDHTQYTLLAGRASGQTLNGGNAANEDLTIHGTAHATKTTSYIILQPSGGDVVIGGTTTDHNFEVQDAGASNYRLTMNVNFSGTNYINSYNGAVGFLTAAPLAFVGSTYTFTTADHIVLQQSKTPASASATGTTGSLAWDSNFLYVAVATNTWKRVAIATW